MQGFRLVDCSIDIVVRSTLECGLDISKLKMAIFDKVDYIEIEPKLIHTIIIQYTHIGYIGFKL